MKLNHHKGKATVNIVCVSSSTDRERTVRGSMVRRESFIENSTNESQNSLPEGGATQA